MAEGSGSDPSVPAPACRRGAGPPPAVRHRCCGGGGGGCGLGLARLVQRLRRQGRRALCAGSALPPPRRLGCQYDPLSYARNFDLGDEGDADAARLYSSCSFSSRFVLAPSSSSSSSSAAAPTSLGSRPIATSL
uniref:Uncharacterized protein n=1 Tax=Arundo donax TaxID=35708 RepID=A0A0A9DBZ0_ARUDO